MQSEVARSPHLYAPADQRIQLAECVKRHGGNAVVLGMVGHAPGEEKNRGVGARGARVGEHVVAEGAADVLCHQKEPQERLPQQCRDHPVDERVRAAEIERERDDDEVAAPQYPRLANAVRWMVSCSAQNRKLRAIPCSTSAGASHTVPRLTKTPAAVAPRSARCTASCRKPGASDRCESCLTVSRSRLRISMAPISMTVGRYPTSAG